MSNRPNKIIIVGGGLAGSEAAWQLASRGIAVTLYEMKPVKFSPAHSNHNLAELVCSNSLGSLKPPKSSALLKKEMEILGSLIIEAAYATRVPSGNALAVDRNLFSKYISDKLSLLPTLEIKREEVVSLDFEEPVLVASGPLTSDGLADEIKKIVGEQFCYFYDAVSPIVDGSTIDMSRVFYGARYEEESDDYLNIPLSKKEYYNFVNNLKNAEIVPLNEADESKFFEGCLPIEEMARRGDETLAFGPMKPVGFSGKKISDDFYAVIQLRKEENSGKMFNIVGFQTRMVFSEQIKVFSSLGALKKASFLRLGRMHRNTYINSRKLLNPDMSLIKRPSISFCGQLSGVEGYVESTASGLAVSLYMLSKLKGKTVQLLPEETLMGSLLNYIITNQNDCEKPQPMNANFGILRPSYDWLKLRKFEMKNEIFKRSIETLKEWHLINFKKG